MKLLRSGYVCHQFLVANTGLVASVSGEGGRSLISSIYGVACVYSVSCDIDSQILTARADYLPHPNNMAHSNEFLELGKLTFAMVIVLLFLAWTTVALRMWVRLRITKSPGWDDATIFMTLVCNPAM